MMAWNLARNIQRGEYNELG